MFTRRVFFENLKLLPLKKDMVLTCPSDNGSVVVDSEISEDHHLEL
jgi:hypothetical protein